MEKKQSTKIRLLMRSFKKIGFAANNSESPARQRDAR